VTEAPEHPAVQRVRATLTAHATATGSEAPEVVWLPDAAATAEAAAAALGVEVGAIANSLVFQLDGVPLLVLTSGAHRVDTGYLGERLGGTIERARPADVKAATGQVIGGVAPVGHPEPLRTVVDVALRAHPRIWAAAGHAHTVYPTTFDELVAITGGTAMDVVPPS
jgi:prolyl-tRNA editing enzyme YbaK/EbsC (Cys-tRNA(Pro) deacylase)